LGGFLFLKKEVHLYYPNSNSNTKSFELTVRAVNNDVSMMVNQMDAMYAAEKDFGSCRCFH